MNQVNDMQESGATPTTVSGDEFIEEFEGRLRDAGLLDTVRVELSAPRDRTVSLDFLSVTDEGNRGKRLASQALQLVLQLADEFGISLEAIPRNLGGPLSDEVLDAWYRRHGFEFVAAVDPPPPLRRAPRSPTGT